MPAFQPFTANLRLFIRLVLAQAFLLGVIFLAAGRIDWLRGWFLAVLLMATMVLNASIIARKNPGLIQERFRTRTDIQPWDRLFLAAYLLSLLAFLVVAGLDGGRFGWSSPPTWSLVPGLLLHLLGNVPLLGALAVNPHAEAVVRIQKDRDQRVITAGPYRYVRHPMYAGGLLMLSGWPLILGALWMYVPLGAIAALFGWRTIREDRLLLRELPGYQDFAAKTRYRWFPGIW